MAANLNEEHMDQNLAWYSEKFNAPVVAVLAFLPLSTSERPTTFLIRRNGASLPSDSKDGMPQVDLSSRYEPPPLVM